MEKILSQEEIADLLSAVRYGEIDVDALGNEGETDSPISRPGKSAVACNLFRVEGPDSWRLKNYDLILDSFARNYAMVLSTRFQRAVQVKLEALESMGFDSLLQRLSGRGAIGVLQLEPLTGGGLLVFDEQLSFAIVEMVLGGRSDNQIQIPSRGMSAIELNVIQDVLQAACPELNKGFAQLTEIDSSLVEVVSNLRLLNFVDLNTGVVVARFKVGIDSLEGVITLVVPHSALEPLQKRQQQKAVPTSNAKNKRWQDLVCDELNHMDVEMEALLATLKLRVRDILGFRIGDVIDLGCKPDAPLQLMVEHRPKFQGIAGVQGGKKAIRVMGRIPNGG